MRMKKVPLGVKIISIIQYVAAIGFVLGGLRSFAVGGALAGVPFLAGVSFLGGVGAILIGVLYFFLGRGMWRAEKWAKTTTITISAILAVLTIVGASNGSGDPGGLIGHAIIFFYLLFSKRVKKAFGEV